MKNDDLLFKLSHNKCLLFIVPNLIYVSMLLYYYNSNSSYDNMLEVSFREVILLLVIFFVITCFIYFLLSKVFKNKQKVFCVMLFIVCFYFFKFTLIQFLLFIVFILILIIDFKKIIRFKLDSIVVIAFFIIFVFFSFSFVSAVYNFSVSIIKSRSYNNKIEFKVNDDKDSPNIYYIHCDGMMGISAMKKYFYYNNTYFTNYLKDNDYYINEDASIINGHKTQRSLVSLFNPNYYDKFYKKYLSDLENVYLGKSKDTSFNVGYYELEDKRLDNELFRALKKKDYTTVGIGEYNQYTSLDTDYYYDYYIHDSDWKHIVDGREGLRYIENSNSDLKKISYVHFIHSKSLSSSTMFYNLIDDLNYLDYRDVDYNDFDTSEYEYIDNSIYWPAKAILKSLDESMNIDNKKFVFIDYNLNHLYLTFDIYGNRLRDNDRVNLNYYDDNYIYSTYLLVDILKIIKNNDSDSVVILEGDHGIHMLDDKYIMGMFSVDELGLQEIRNSVISAIYIPDKYRNGDEEYLDNPLNISRYIVNSYVGDNYEYLD